MRLKTFYQTLKNTLTSAAYYSQILQTSFSFSVRFFIMTMLVLGLSTALMWRQRNLPRIETHLLSYVDLLRENYPPELILSWNEVRLKNNLSAPLEISYPDDLDRDPDILPGALAYLSPTDLPLGEFGNTFAKSSLVVISPESIYVNDLADNWSIFSLREILDTGPFHITAADTDRLAASAKTSLSHEITKLKNMTWVAAPLFVVIHRFWLSLIHSLFGFLLLKINRFDLSFVKTWQLGLHVSVVAEVISQINQWLYPNLAVSMFSMSFWVVGVYVVWRGRIKSNSK